VRGKYVKVCKKSWNYFVISSYHIFLSRGVSGIRNNTLIINLPGSPKACRENLEYIIPALKHGLEILTGKVTNCAEPGHS
jgi:molybdopterin biosynthesis enzyme MoaB